MDDHGQFQLISERELRFEGAPLRGLWALVPMVIEADFTDCDDLWRARQLAQVVEHVFAEIGAAVGMDADRSVDALFAPSERDRFAAAWQINRRDDNSQDAGIDGAPQHIGAIMIISLKIEMAVGIDQLHQMTRFGLSLSFLRSASTIMPMSSSKLTSGAQPSACLALVGSPTSRSTSAGRMKRWSCTA